MEGAGSCLGTYPRCVGVHIQRGAGGDDEGATRSMPRSLTTAVITTINIQTFTYAPKKKDRRHFFHLTRGHVLVLGRRSYEASEARVSVPLCRVNPCQARARVVAEFDRPALTHACHAIHNAQESGHALPGRTTIVVSRTLGSVSQSISGWFIDVSHHSLINVVARSSRLPQFIVIIISLSHHTTLRATMTFAGASPTRTWRRACPRPSPSPGGSNGSSSSSRRLLQTTAASSPGSVVSACVRA